MAEDIKIFSLNDGAERKGRKNLKRMLLGFFGRKAFKSVDDVARTLIMLGARDSFDESRKLIQQLYGRVINYGGGFLSIIDKGTNSRGEEICLIYKGFPEDCDDYAGVVSCNWPAD